MFKQPSVITKPAHISVLFCNQAEKNQTEELTEFLTIQNLQAKKCHITQHCSTQFNEVTALNLKRID